MACVIAGTTDLLAVSIITDLSSSSWAASKRRSPSKLATGLTSRGNVCIVCQIWLPVPSPRAHNARAPQARLALASATSSTRPAFSANDLLISGDRLRLGRHGFGIFKHKHHQEGDDGRAGVDDELPCFRVPEERPADRSEKNKRDGKDESPLFLNLLQSS